MATPWIAFQSIGAGGDTLPRVMTPGTRWWRMLTLMLALRVSSGLAIAQTVETVPELMKNQSVRRALDLVRRSEPDTISNQIRLCEVPAPPFGEAARAAVYADAMRNAGLTNVRTDAEGNVLGDRPGRSVRPHLVLSAHLDTVFPSDVPVRVTRSGSRLDGPGIADDCRGLAVVLAVARSLRAAAVRTNGSITFVGTVGEEGLGDLRGVRALFSGSLKGRIDRFVSVDGDGYGIVHVGVGSRRYRVTFRGPGGHSFDDFGRASPVNALGLAIAAISGLTVPATPKTTFSVGRIGGGTSINSIAAEAWMEVDLRSTDAAALSELDARVRAIFRHAIEEENSRRQGQQPITVEIASVGNRPAGRTEMDTLVVRTALAALRALALPVRLDAGSTDANMPMSVGIPSITVGGGGAARDLHSPQESFDTTDSWKGTQLVTLLTVALAQ
jgi:acetylornithine deacetylase/succinyl-diaminopimelate desuccinylase-like protein